MSFAPDGPREQSKRERCTCYGKPAEVFGRRSPVGRSRLFAIALGVLIAAIFGLTAPVSALAEQGGVLIVSPHPDDDILFAAGVAASAVAEGRPVKVVYMTNGDVWGAESGLARQDQAVEAQTRFIGTAESDLIFLGYPDGGMADLLFYYTQPTDAATVNGISQTYGNRGLGGSDFHTFRFGLPAAYNAPNVVTDFDAILADFRPDDIYTTSEFDNHTDHMATYAFVRQALVRRGQEDPTYRPEVHKTMVWCADDWPTPIDPTRDHTPIPGLTETTGLLWSSRESVRVPLPMQSADLASNPKYQAVFLHVGAHDFLCSFVHRDEVFWLDEPTGKNHAPTASALAPVTAGPGGEVRLDGSGSADADGNVLTYAWTQLSGPAVMLSEPTAVSPTFTAPETHGTLTFGLVVSDGITTSTTDTVPVAVAVPGAPVADAGADTAAVTGATVHLTGAASRAPSGRPLTYAWTQISGTTVTLSDPTAVSPSFTAPDTADTLAFNLVVSDGIATSADDTVIITVSVPGAPLANAGLDAAAVTGATVHLTGAASTAPSGRPLTYAWSQVSGFPVTLSDPTAVSPTFTAPSVQGTLVFNLVVSDGIAASAADMVVITVTGPNLALNALATASSQNLPTGQDATKAIDGVVDGYPGDYTREWATQGGRAGSWLRLDWAASPVTLSSVVLHDRPNSGDQITGAHLNFSDGSSVPVGVLPNSGAALTVTFPDKTVSWIELVVDTVSESTLNVGLSEFEAYGTDSPVPLPPVANAGPDSAAKTGATVQLTGVASTAPSGRELSYTWTQVSGTPVTLSDPTAVAPTFTAPFAADTLVFNLVVSDGINTSSADSMVVTVNSYLLTYTGSVNGTIVGTSPQAVAYLGSGTAVTALANPGYHFVGWSDGILTATRTDANVTADLEVAAVFSIDTYTLTYTPGAHGTITGTSPQTVAHGASGTAVTAQPDSGYHFVTWSDGNKSATRTDGNVIADLNVTATFAATTYITQWGSLGSGNGQFNQPAGMAFDSSGNIYVVDCGNDRVQKFTSTGAYLTQWGTSGTGNGQFSVPWGIAVDSAGDVYVVDEHNNRVQKFTNTGTYLTQWGTPGSGNGQFNAPWEVAIDPSGNVYVTDSGNNRIQKFTSTGAYLTQWGSYGTGDGQFGGYDIGGIASDASGNIYVTDQVNSRVQKFTGDGTYLSKWGSSGSGNGQFDYPTGISLDTHGDIYVADVYNNRIQKFTSTGAYVTQWGGPGTGNGQFNQPWEVAVDSAGNSYVADYANNRIQKFGPVGQTYTLTSSAGAGGSISPLGDTTVVEGGDRTFTITPNTGYHVATLTVDGSPVAPAQSYTFTDVSQAHTITAAFAVNTYTLTYTAGAGGTITGTSPQVVDHGASGTAVTAVPDTGYHFVGWSDGILTAARTDTDVAADKAVTAAFAVNTYTLTYTAGAGGTITGTSPQVVDHGASGTAVTAVPDTGYHFVGWSDGILTAARTDTDVAADKAVTAAFAVNTYTLTYTAGAGGTITGTSPQVVDHGASGTAVTAVPDTGYHFVGWSDGILTAARTDTDVAADKAVTAAFAVNTYTLTYTAGAGGTITGTSPQVVDHGASGTAVTAVPDTGYHFVGWSDGILTAARTDTDVAADKAVTAAFAVNTYTLTYTAGAGGTITGTSPQVVDHGASGTAVTAVPDTGYHFVGWSDGILTAARTDTDVAADKAVTAAFAVNTYTLTYTAGAGGTITGTSPQVVDHGASGTAVTAVPDTGYHFVGWSDGILTAARTDTDVAADKAVTAAFAVNTYTLTYTAGAGGTITGTSPQVVDHGASGTAVTAVPDTGYHFVGWSDGILTAARTDTDVAADKAVTAAFAVNTYTLTYTAGAGGTITGTSPQVVDHGASGTAVTAVPDTGYHFVGWSDGILTAARTDTDVAADKAVTAAFAVNTYTLTYTAGAGGTITGTSPQVVDHGASGTAVTAVPDTGYHFVGWSDGILTAARTDTDVAADKAVTAAFAVNTYTLTYTAGAGGTITGTSPQVVDHGASGTAVTAVPDTGYHFVGWSDGILTAARTDTDVAADKAVTAAFAVNTYTLTYTAGAGGTITGTSPQVVDHGASGTAVTAVPDTGYHFVGWSDGILTAARTDTDVAADKAVTAAFAVNTYTLTYTAGAGGTITGTSPQVVDHGASGTAVTAVPDTGYHFVGWSDGILTAARTDTDVAADKAVTAAFAVNTYTLTYTAGAGGTITGTSPQVVDHGASGTAVTAVPDTGYHFVGWSDGILTAARTDTDVAADKAVTAAFAVNTYTLTYTAGAGGTITGTSPQVVDHGASGTAVTAVPDTGYHFVGWSDGILTAARTDTDVAADKAVTAAFAVNTYTLTYTAGAGGTITGTSPQVVDHGASGTAVTAVPDTGYHFVGWSDGILTAARTDTDVAADKAVTAAFAVNTYTLTYTAGAGGTITGTSPQVVDHGASGTAVTAVPDTGYHFVGWSDGILTAARTDTDVAADKAVTAAFAVLPTRFEQSDARVTYSGPWATSSSSSLSGGSYASGYATATALVKFDGTAIDLIGTKGRWGGIAEVSVDGGAYTLVDFYAPATANQQVVWSAFDLDPGPHTVAISSTVRRNPSSVGGNTYLDAFDVSGSLLQASTRYQQVDPKVTWSGSWATNTSTSLSGGSYAGAGPGAIMLATFDGTAFDLIGTLSPYGGIAEVSIDGAAPVDADFYGGAATSHKRRVWGVSGLSSGPHTIALTVTTRRNPASLGGMAYVDALDVSGTLAQSPTRYQQTDTRIGFSGPWTTTSSTSLSGGSYTGGTNGATLSLAFDGTAIDLVGTKSLYGGIATVSIDGGTATDADFYGPATAHKQRIWSATGLAPGRHTLTLTVTNRRNPSSLGGNAYVDAFDVAGALVE